MFREYMHLERFGNDEVQGIELGRTYVFPKIDGTNASTWLGHDGGEFLCSGSRTRELSEASDNAGFHKWVIDPKAEHNLFSFHNDDWNLRLYGEWLVPHSFKGYREDAWRKFYVFDVYNDKTEQYLPYEVYQPLLEHYGIEYIPPLAIVKSGSYDHFLRLLDENRYLCPDGGEPGEGIVIKNYDFYNKYGRQVWAKIVRQEFKEIHAKAMGAPEINSGLMNEERIVNRSLTSALVDKTYAKILADKWDVKTDSPVGWSSKFIPELLDRVFYDIIKEELWDAWKEIKFETINGKVLKSLVIRRIKELKPEVF